MLKQALVIMSIGLSSSACVRDVVIARSSDAGGDHGNGDGSLLDDAAGSEAGSDGSLVPSSWQRIGGADELALPNWYRISPDGRYVAYLAIRQLEGGGIEALALRLLDRQTDQETTLATKEELTYKSTGGKITVPLWSKVLIGFTADSRHLLIRTADPEARANTAYVLATGQTFDLPADVHVLGLTPDGNVLVQQSVGSNSGAIALFDLDARTTTALMSGVDTATDPRIEVTYGGTTDQPTLVAAFYDDHSPKHRVLQSVPFTGGTPVLIAEDSIGTSVSLGIRGVAPDRVLYTSPASTPSDAKLFVAPISGGTPRELAMVDVVIRTAVLSPAGQRALWHDPTTNTVHVAMLDVDDAQTIDGETLGLENCNGACGFVFTSEDAFAYRAAAGVLGVYSLTSNTMTTIGPGSLPRRGNGRTLYTNMVSTAAIDLMSFPGSSVRLGELRILEGSSSTLIGSDIDSTSLSQWSGLGEHLLVSVMYFDVGRGMAPGPANGLYVVPLVPQP